MSGPNRLQRLKLVIFDVDGVLTDGRTWQDIEGRPRRYFSVRDTMGLRALRKAGLKVMVISASGDTEIREHMNFVGVDEFHAPVDKSQFFPEVLARYSIDFQDVGYVSADQADLSLLAGIGFSATILSASHALHRATHFVTSRVGGDGAVLEICNLILQHTQKSGSQQSRSARVSAPSPLESTHVDK